MSWAPMDPKYLTAVHMRCAKCGGIYVIHSMSYRIGQMVLSIDEKCECGSSYGETIGPVPVEDEWPEFIDA